MLQAIFWPGSFDYLQTALGRILVVTAGFAYSAMIAFAYWVGFARVSPIGLRLASAKLCFWAAVFSVVAPIGVFGLSKLAWNPESVSIEFGESGIATIISLAVCLYGLDVFSKRYEALWKEQELWRFPNEPRDDSSRVSFGLLRP
jgi:hypothetical protein